ncbi:MAG: helix-turn-helix domain-containing protein [Candidatus Absconditabacterales bacterium]|nr:helix-turn-helix domain-containing protein [Candidatus Absconditabacterales bacterium]
MGYTYTREEAAEQLGVSTRTIDRYIKSGKVSYKKVANKVYLNDDDIASLAKDFQMVRQEPQRGELYQDKITTDTITQLSLSPDVNAMIDAKIERFFHVFAEKEKIINEKDKMIFVLQQRIGELEAKIKTMVALPDYNAEKQALVLERQKLGDVIKTLESELKEEKTKNTIYIGMLLIVVTIILFIVLSLR